MLNRRRKPVNARNLEFEKDFKVHTIGMIGGMSWECPAISVGSD
jgi:hypothetical protein